jgi:hypothetical protein
MQCPSSRPAGTPRKKVDNYCHALALYFVFYNFVRIRLHLDWCADDAWRRLSRRR